MAKAPKLPKKLALCNMKGGVGKTASAVNIAASFAVMGKRTLLVDCDYQGNSSDYLNLKLQAVTNKMTLFDGIRHKKSVEDCVLPTAFMNLDLIASSLDLSTWEKQGYKYKKIMSWLDNDYIKRTYDYIVFDTRPQLGSLFDNILAYVDWYLVPLFAEADALSGLKIVFNELGEIQEAYNPNLRCAGLLVTKFNPKNATHVTFLNVIETICAEHKIELLGTIPQSDALAGSVNRFVPLAFYLDSRRNLPIRDAYRKLGEKLYKKLAAKSRCSRKVPQISDNLVEQSMEQLKAEAEVYFE